MLFRSREVIFAEDLEKIFGKRKGEQRKELDVTVDETVTDEE